MTLTPEEQEVVDRAQAIQRIDYLKFIVKTDEREFQERYAWVFNDVNTWLVKQGCKPGKLTALGVGTDGLRRYCIEWYGDSAGHAVEMIPTHWYTVMYRIDLREQMELIEAADIQAMQAYVAVRPKGRTGTSSFHTRPATKNHMRDVGGVGLRFGSRKSDKHAVLYKRGRERSAFEFRLQGRASQELGREWTKVWENNVDQTATAYLIRKLLEMRAKYLNEVAGVADPNHLMQLADEANAYMPMMFDDTEKNEVAEANAWWTSLTEQEQLDWQRDNFKPTIKGWEKA